MQGGPEVAVVGGGISGATCAHFLSKMGYQVSVFDMGKSRPGGRMSSRQTLSHNLMFDHGCQFLTATTGEFQQILGDWMASGAVKVWQGRIVDLDAQTGKFKVKGDDDTDQGFFSSLAAGVLYVGTPDMGAICQHLLPDQGPVHLRHNVRVKKAALNKSKKWLLEGEPIQRVVTKEDAQQLSGRTPFNLGVFDALVLADKMTAIPNSPGYIVMEGLEGEANLLYERLQQVGSIPLFALMLAYEGPLDLLPFDAASVSNSPHISWLANTTSKPDRVRADGVQCWTVLCTEAYSKELLGPNAEGPLPKQTPEYLVSLTPQIYDHFLNCLRGLLGSSTLPHPIYMQAHRWGSALPRTPVGSACVSNSQARLVACGDFCLGPGVENAVLSGLRAADTVRQIFE